MKISDDRFEYVVSFNLIVFSIGLIWRILIEFFDIFSNPERETIFLKVGGVSIVIGLLLAIPLVRLDIKGENLDLKKQFWHVFAINNFFWFGAIVWILYLMR